MAARDKRRILIHATNWLGDAVMSLPAARAVRARFPEARITLLGRPVAASLYRRESCVDEVVEYPAARGAREAGVKWRLARRLGEAGYDTALLLPNSLESAAVAALAGIPERVGYKRDGRSALLTVGVAPPAAGEIPLYEGYYYLELLRRAGWIEELPGELTIRFDGLEEARLAGRRRFESLGLGVEVVGVSPGAAYGGAKRWLPERFAEAAGRVARELGAGVALMGSAGERELCGRIAAMEALRGLRVGNLAGETTTAELIEAAAACRVFLTNDSGAMHVAASAGAPTVAVFGATDPIATGPTGGSARVVRQAVECSPCLLRECPIDHRCMTGVEAGRVAEAALKLLK